MIGNTEHKKIRQSIVLTELRQNVVVYCSKNLQIGMRYGRVLCRRRITEIERESVVPVLPRLVVFTGHGIFFVPE